MCFHKIIQNLYKTTKYMVEMSNWGNKIRDYEKVIHPYNSESLAYKKNTNMARATGRGQLHVY